MTILRRADKLPIHASESFLKIEEGQVQRRWGTSSCNSKISFVNRLTTLNFSEFQSVLEFERVTPAITASG